MSKLPRETLKRIEWEAMRSYPTVNTLKTKNEIISEFDFQKARQFAHIDAAIAESERAMELVEALEKCARANARMNLRDDYIFSRVDLAAITNMALAKYQARGEG